MDHYGDLPSFWLGGTVMNRLTPLRIWGPSGEKPEYGTQYAMDRMQEYVRLGYRDPSQALSDFRGGALEVQEFDYKGVNEVIYNENGVVIRSIPAVHGIDGAVQFHPGMEWTEIRVWQRHGAE